MCICRQLRHLYLEQCSIGENTLLDAIVEHRLFNNLTNLHLNESTIELQTLLVLIEHRRNSRA